MTAAGAALDFLRRDTFRNLPFLKMLATYGEHCRLEFENAAGREAAMLLLPVAASAFDRATYAKAEWVVLLAAARPADAAPLLDRLPPRCGLVFKIAAPFADVVRAARPIRRITAFVSYTWPADRATAADPRVTVSRTTDLLGRKLRAAMPKTLEDVLPYFDSGDARLFTIAEGDAPVAGCLSFPNFEDIHEIGVLYTMPGFRHRGYARALAATAAHDLRARKLVARFQAAEDNASSRAVATAAGFVEFLTLEHWVSDRSASVPRDRAR